MGTRYALCIALAATLGVGLAPASGRAHGTRVPAAAPARHRDGAAASTATQAGARPNVLIIVTDDQRVATMRQMPATKRFFRARGTTFTNAFATTPLCCPSRASIMSGRYVHNHDVRVNKEGPNLDQTTTIQAHLDAAGYQTALAGKFLNGWSQTEAPPYFDRWATFYPRRALTNDAQWRGMHSYRKPLFNEDGRLRLVDKYSTDHIRARSLDFLKAFEERDADPWMLYVAPYAPHKPSTPAERHRGTPVGRWKANPAVRERDRTDKPVWVQQRDVPAKRVRTLRRKQLRTLTAVDELVERLFRDMRRLDEARNTIAFFLSDNGYLWAEHGLGGKEYPYLRSTRIPLIVRWPGRFAGGAKDDRLVANIDLAPTVLHAAGIEVTPQQHDGRSLLQASDRDRLLLEFFDDDGNPPSWASTVTSSYQYIEYYEDDLLIGRELYDLIEDRWQLNNVFADIDPTNDPLPTEATQMSLQLADDRDCRGTDDCP